MVRDLIKYSSLSGMWLMSGFGPLGSISYSLISHWRSSESFIVKYIHPLLMHYILMGLNRHGSCETSLLKSTPFNIHFIQFKWVVWSSWTIRWYSSFFEYPPLSLFIPFDNKNYTPSSCFDKNRLVEPLQDHFIVVSSLPLLVSYLPIQLYAFRSKWWTAWCLLATDCILFRVFGFDLRHLGVFINCFGRGWWTDCWS